MDGEYFVSTPVVRKVPQGGGLTVVQPDVNSRDVVPTSVEIQVTFGTPTVLLESALQARAFTFFVNGVDRSENFLLSRQPATFGYQIGSRGSANARAFSRDGTYRPAIDQEFLIYENETGLRLFGGIIVNTEEVNYKGLAAHEVGIRVADYGTLLDRAIVSAYFPPFTQGIIYTTETMIIELLNVYMPQTGIRFVSGGAGGTIIMTEMVFPDVTGTQAIQMVLDRSPGLDFFVDQYKGLHLINSTGGWGNAPFNIADNDGHADSIAITRDSTKYANWVGVRPDLREPALWHDTFTGDGVNRGFITRYAIELAAPVILVNGIRKTVQAYYAYAPGGADFSYGPNSVGVFSSPYQPPWGTSDIIDVYYPGKLQPLTIAKDDALIAQDGLVQTIVEVKDIYDRDLLQEIADGILARLKVKPTLANVKTKFHGLLPGHKINVNTTRPLCPSTDLVVSSVNCTITGRKTLDPYRPVGARAWAEYQFTAGNSLFQAQGNYEQQIIEARKARVQTLDKTRRVIAIELAIDIPGLTNPGLEALVVPTRHTIDHFGFAKIARLTFDDPPQDETVQILVYRTDSAGVTESILADDEYFEFRPADAGLVVMKFIFRTIPYPVQPGDYFTCEVITADPTAKNGKLEIDIQT